ncbi:alternate-type signal peptide domain-containing protein [Pseudarthrobacter sp. NIBRBAC000502771]|uniref:alternate-type signal peptide domain-containing protein n=1 Tax=Pseudarthrobacter sp. NIBRBAC000502771 TaxID=2590774 RepID=UPI00112FE6DE|nr:alternate-type signal peptide domain-containing protein [Pseudarthrobacter sp. NIBRBAC000502771]QDG62615.1 alternate-type signal peptide domain-containing protein [Pseudarthrobacter sp. NIBRBAC000502771]
MKNSTLVKGTAAIAVGAALLLGGGGTLANWNASTSAAPGSIIAGDLNVAKAGTGVWTDGAGKEIDIKNYRVVPGDNLTFTQNLTVTLLGDKMAASITAAGVGPNSGFTGNNVVVSDPLLKIGAATVANPLKPTGADQNVTASITFNFKSATPGLENVKDTYNFADVKFTLQQVTQPGLS